MSRTDKLVNGNLVMSTSVFGPNQLTEEDINCLVECGICQIEMSGFLPRFDYNDSDYVEKIAGFISKSGISVRTWHGTGSHAMAGRDKVEQERNIAGHKKCIDVALMFSPECYVIHWGDQQGISGQMGQNAWKSSINEILSYCKERGIKLVIETPPVRDQLVIHANVINEFVRSFDDPYLGICLDTNHANLDDDLEQVTRACSDKILDIHISDNDGTTERHWMPGWGIIDWGRFGELIRELEYAGPLVLEVSSKGFKDSYDAIQYIIREMPRVLRNLY